MKCSIKHTNTDRQKHDSESTPGRGGGFAPEYQIGGGNSVDRSATGIFEKVLAWGAELACTVRLCQVQRPACYCDQSTNCQQQYPPKLERRFSALSVLGL